MTESRQAYVQIAETAAPRIALFNQTFALTPPHAEQVISYAPETVELMRKNPELVPTAMGNYDTLVEEYNALVGKESPLLAFFPHSRHLGEVLTGVKQRHLPTLEELQKNPHWKDIAVKGIENAASYIELGNCVEPQNGGPASFLKAFPKGNQIISPARADLDPETRLSAIEGHVVERIYLAWLEENGYIGSKDEVLGMFDEMIQYRHITGNLSSLEDPYIKLRWVKQEKLTKLQQQFNLESNELPGAIPGSLSPLDRKDTVFNDMGCLNYYEDPNPLLSHLIARKIGSLSEKVSAQMGVTPGEAFSAILDTGKGITTVSFGRWRKEGKEMSRSCEIRTRGGDSVGSIDHVLLSATQNPDGSLDYSIDRYGFGITFKHTKVQAGKQWIRTFSDEKHNDEFAKRPAIPLMANEIASQVQGVAIDYFAMRYPDSSARAIVESVLGKDAIVDEEKDVILVPAEKRYRLELRSDEVLFRKQSLSQFIAEIKKKCDPGENYAVCDEVFEAKYSRSIQPITATGYDAK